MIDNYYRIGGHLINIITEQNEFDRTGSFAPFSSSVNEEESILFKAVLRKSTTRELIRNELVRFEWDEEECTVYHTERGYEIELIFLEDRNRKALMSANIDFSYAEIESEGGDAVEWFFINNFIMMLYAFASATHDTAMLHASTVTIDDIGYVFLGHSGTGKSTHSRLWLENIKKSRLLNDDNPIVRLVDGKTIIYGSPWSGKTPCYINASAEVRAFVILEQASENSVVRLKTAQALATLMAATSCLKHDERVYDGVCETLTAIVAKVPVYRLKCRPDAEAAVLCHTTVTK